MLCHLNLRNHHTAGDRQHDCRFLNKDRVLSDLRETGGMVAIAALETILQRTLQVD